VKNIQARPFFYPLHLQRLYKKFIPKASMGIRRAEGIYFKGINIPSSVG